MLGPTTSKPDRARPAFAILLGVGLAAGCGAEPVRVVEPVPAPAPTVAPVPMGDPVRFVFTDTDGKTLSADALRGRITVVLLVTTYDVESQAMVQVVKQLLREHVPRINAVALVLEVEKNRVLVDAYARALDPGYPVALAAESWIRGEGAFPGLRSVPAVAILDKEGREAARHAGFLKKAEIDALIRQVEEGSR